MEPRVVVLGAGYAGTGVVTALRGHLPDADLVWVSERDYHLVRHEVHRAVRDPAVARHLRIPVADVAGPATTFRQGTVTGFDAADRTVHLADGGTLDYDYLVVALGSRTAFYGIPGLAERALTLGSLDDAQAIHDRVLAAGREATPDAPARVVVGGAGLSGVQLAGEVAELRDREGLPVEVTVVEAMDEVMPGSDAGLREAVARRLRARSIATLTGSPVVEVDDGLVHVEGGVDAAGVEADDSGGVEADVSAGVATDDSADVATGDSAGVDADDSAGGGAGDSACVEADDSARVEGSDNPVHVETAADPATTESGDDPVPADAALPWDVLVWTGGITGPAAIEAAAVERERHRVRADRTLRTSDDRVFALGDVAVVDRNGDPVPATAQAAWQAAEAAARNVARAVAGEPLERWRYRDRGTLVSVGDAAVAHDVPAAPVETFGGPPARLLKKLVAARWIASVTSWRRGLGAWPVL